MSMTANLLLPVTVPALSHGGYPVVATGMLAKLYGCTKQDIMTGFEANRHMFTEGKHHHTLTGQALRAFRPYAASQGLHLAARAGRCLLWRRQGAALHAHLRGTCMAWQAFEQLEETLFAVTQSPGRAVEDAAPTEHASPRRSPQCRATARHTLEHLRRRLGELEPALAEGRRLIRDIRDTLAPLHLDLLDESLAGQGRGASFERVLSLLCHDTYTIEDNLNEAANGMRHCLLRGKDILNLLEGCR